MEFNAKNNVVKLCLQGIGMEENGKNDEAEMFYLQAWNEATVDFEKFLAAYYLGRNQKNIADRLHWLETSLQYAININNDSVNSALPSLYLEIASCYKESGKIDSASKYNDLATMYRNNPSDKGPFYHGTRADLKVGDLLVAGGNSNYNSELKMNHIYFTGIVSGAGLAAALAKGDGRERVYIIEPTGIFENDPNVTDKKFPGNPSRSYRSHQPLKIVGEITEWERLTPEEIHQWREKLSQNKGEIIN